MRLLPLFVSIASSRRPSRFALERIRLPRSLPTPIMHRPRVGTP
jgi:hypothetical protein